MAWTCRKKDDVDCVKACTRLVVGGKAPVGMPRMTEHDVCRHASAQSSPSGCPRLRNGTRDSVKRTQYHRGNCLKTDDDDDDVICTNGILDAGFAVLLPRESCRKNGDHKYVDEE